MQQNNTELLALADVGFCASFLSFLLCLTRMVMILVNLVLRAADLSDVQVIVICHSSSYFALQSVLLSPLHL